MNDILDRDVLDQLRALANTQADASELLSLACTRGLIVPAGVYVVAKPIRVRA